MYMLGMALLDSLNPAAISILIFILPMVKKTWHAVFFIGGAFMTYLLTGLVFYYGIDRFAKKWLFSLLQAYPLACSITGMILGGLLIGVGVLYTVRIVRSFRHKEAESSSGISNIKSVHPMMLLGLSITSTLGDAPTSIPYIVFISHLTEQHVPFSVMMLNLIVYCFIFVLPMLVLYIAYGLIKEKFNFIETVTRKVMNKLSKYAVPAMAYAAGIWLFYISI
ncbi:GAP family protein [Paenibacillus sp. UNC451MF]|uniref:GAP family protein n=1 Tax=Paenibacillus sp. UNC451MF TaxID=1449063 RepID=UPI000491DAE6|nr:GAP family protein [Paenibacillus sp. UNC451MF]